jgi:hypothetical protein
MILATALPGYQAPPTVPVAYIGDAITARQEFCTELELSDGIAGLWHFMVREPSADVMDPRVPGSVAKEIRQLAWDFGVYVVWGLGFPVALCFRQEWRRLDDYMPAEIRKALKPVLACIPG